MIRLQKYPQREEFMRRFSYTKDDMLNLSEVSLYQFNAMESGETVLAPVNHNEYGFIVPTFNETLDALSDEVYALREEE